MYQILFLCLLAFSIYLANCEYVRNVSMDIRVQEAEGNRKRVECQSPNPNVVKVIDGEQIQLIVQVPYDVDIMWCETVIGKVRTVDAGQQLGSIFTTLTRFNASQRGEWVCTYMLATKGTVQPIVLRDGHMYTRTICTLAFEVVARHDIETCPAPVCDIDNCGLLHHRLLHWKKPVTVESAEEASTVEPSPPHAPATERAPRAPARASNRSDATVAHVAAFDDSAPAPEGDIMLKVVAVKLRGPYGEVQTYALLDDAASVSIIDSDLADQLGLKSESASDIKFIDAFGLEVFQSDAPRVRAKISGHDRNSFDINLRKVSKLNLPAQNLSVVNKISCTYLSRIKDVVCNKRVVPRILIGEDNYFIIAPLEVIHGNKNSPYATRCRLGWTIHGYCGRARSAASQVSHQVCHLAHANYNGIDSTAIDMDALNELIKHSFSLESIGISTLCRENTAHSRAIEVLDESARLVGNRWEVGLPFKQDCFNMPNTYNYAISRMQTLLNKFEKDCSYADRYNTEINKLLAEGYARELQENEPSSKHIWYIPHFGVQNPNKPGKLRLVFDAAAKVNNKCLNDYLLTGPDLYNSLLGIMLRFRENEFVIIGDIKDMFLRIQIRPEDQHVFRFLWQQSSKSPLKTCVMQSLIFGATCSPFVAQHIKNKNALKYDDQYPEAVQAIVNSHYMDDCYYSTSSEQNAIKLIKDITYIHKQGGFEIRNWSSNSKHVLQAIPADALAQSAVRFKDGATNMTERTLGLMWHPADDTFSIKVSVDQIPIDILNGTVPPTKAKMLSIIMSVYDIHGFLSPFTIKSKILLQDVHRSGIDWKCRIQSEEHVRWVQWLAELKQLEALRIPRWYLRAGAWTPCYSLPSTSTCNKVVDIQLHVFCDSSLKAFAAAVYWRLTRADGSVLVCLAASKSRVTPLRPVSVPRLELQGALLGSRLAKTIIAEQKDLNPESGRNIDVDIQLVKDKRRVECQGPNVPVKLVDGEPIQLVAKAPYPVDHMWCGNHEVKLADGNKQTESEYTTHVTRFHASDQGTWECKYLMNTMETVKPLHQNYTMAECKLNFEVTDTLWLTGLNPNRTTTSKQLALSRTNYNYKYERGEKIIISCEAHSEFKIMEFKLYDAIKNYTYYTGKRFEALGDFDLSGSCLICSAVSPNYGTKHEILLDLEMIAPGYLWFTGLDLNRVTTIHTGDDSGQIYKYKYYEGEFLKINCERNTNVRMYNFRFITRGKLETNLTGKWLEDTADSCFNEAKLICETKSPKYKIQLNFNKISGDPPTVPPTPTPRSSAIPTPVAPVSGTTTRLLQCTPTNIPTTTTTALTSPLQPPSLDIVGDDVKLTNNDTAYRTKTYLYEFSEPGSKNVTCQYNRDSYIVELYDNDTPFKVQKNKAFVGGKVTVSFNFLLEYRTKTVTCTATQAGTSPRIFKNTLQMVYKNNPEETIVTKTPTTTESATTPPSQSPFEEASSFLEKNGLVIGVGCAIVITLCVVACCLKVMCSKTKPQTPEDHVNLTSDRGNEYNTTMAAPIRTMPKIESTYCDPKDTLGRRNNSDPNYSEAKEPQGMGEGLYAELNRPEDTYAEPYIDKTEAMYARPVPKAQRKKEDPNYSNVFGLYVNSKK